MHFLELKVPPPLVCLLFGVGMWGLAKLDLLVALPETVRLVAALSLALVGAGFQLAGIFTFRSAKTTINPLKPETASALVSSGVFRLTRNPMYVGFASLLMAWAVWLSAPSALLGPVAFVLYINRFQIVPEERVLSSLFGTSFAEYKSKVRRWF